MRQRTLIELAGHCDVLIRLVLTDGAARGGSQLPVGSAGAVALIVELPLRSLHNVRRDANALKIWLNFGTAVGMALLDHGSFGSFCLLPLRSEQWAEYKEKGGGEECLVHG